MEESIYITKEGACLNCGAEVQGNYCSNCGQKMQPTKLPLRLFLEDVVETLFTIDNRFFRTLGDLFFKPGKVTKEYIDGKRAKYLPPLRVYISISVVYFLLAQFIESDKILFVNFTQDEDSNINLAKVIQAGLFLLVPVMAGLLKLLHRKRKAFYIEYLIFSIHIHSIWFVFFTIQLLLMSLAKSLSPFVPSIVESMISVLVDFSQISAMIYLVIYVKKVFQETWLKAILKSIIGLFLYLACLGLITFLALWFF